MPNRTRFPPVKVGAGFSEQFSVLLVLDALKAEEGSATST